MPDYLKKIKVLFKKTLEIYLTLHYYMFSSSVYLTNGEKNFMIYGVLEIEIMNAMWSLQAQDEDTNISVSDIVEALNRNEVERAYTTVKTVMDRLVGKDVLVRYRNGKKFFYRTAVDKNESAKQAIEMVSNHYFENDYSNMMRFIESECASVLV